MSSSTTRQKKVVKRKEKENEKEKLIASVIVAMRYENSKDEPLTFYSDMSINEIKQKTLKAFGLDSNTFQGYEILIEAIGCYAKDFEHFKETLKYRLERVGISEDYNEEIFFVKQQANTSQSEEMLEILSRKSQICLDSRTSDEEMEEFVDGDNWNLADFDVLESKSNLEEESKQECEEVEIDLENIREGLFEDRKVLGARLKKWSHFLKFKMKFTTREQTLVKDQSKVSTLKCNKKKCPFFLEFRTSERRMNQYKLKDFYNFHNHYLIRKDTSSEVTPHMLAHISYLKALGMEPTKITEGVNEEFEMEFPVEVISYQLTKLTNEILGRPTEDANVLVSLLKRDAEKRGTLYTVDVDEKGSLKRFCFITPRMKSLLKSFTDVIIIDSSHQTNRFGLPLLDIVVIDNYGKTCLCFIALLDSNKYSSFLWALKKFKENLEISQSPKIIFSDDEEGLRKAIKTVFSSSKNFLCTWHLEQNLKKRALFLKKKLKKDSNNTFELKKNLYKAIVKLPHSEYESDYMERYNRIIESKYLDQSFVEYLKNKHKERAIWVKAWIKSRFTCGTSATSRIESKHRSLKRYLNNTTRLSKLFITINQIEKQEFEKQEKALKLNQKEKIGINSNILIKKCAEIYTDYATERFKLAFIESLNYSVKKCQSYWIVTRFDVSHKITKNGPKICCDCFDDLYFGVPCRHLIAISVKLMDSKFEVLPFEERWKKCYYNPLTEAVESLEFPIGEKEKNQETTNPSPKRGPGRKSGKNKRQKSVVEKSAQKSSKRRKRPTPSNTQEESSIQKIQSEAHYKEKKVKKSR